MNDLVTKLGKFALISYTVVLAYWMLLGFGRIHSVYPNYMYNIVPFQTIKHFLQVDRFNTEIWVINLLGNIGIFMPFGILIPIVFGHRFLKTYGIFLGGVLILELLQLVSRRGSFDIDDLILNSLGYIMGYGIYRAFMASLKSSNSTM